MRIAINLKDGSRLVTDPINFDSIRGSGSLFDAIRTDVEKNATVTLSDDISGRVYKTTWSEVYSIEIVVADQELPPLEMELLERAASGDGEIVLMDGPGIPTHVQIGQHKYFKDDDPSYAAYYKKAFDGLLRSGLIAHKSRLLYSLTADGWDVAKALKSAEGA